jgi:hypothetical protein
VREQGEDVGEGEIERKKVKKKKVLGEQKRSGGMSKRE